MSHLVPDVLYIYYLNINFVFDIIFINIHTYNRYIYIHILQKNFINFMPPSIYALNGCLACTPSEPPLKLVMAHIQKILYCYFSRGSNQVILCSKDLDTRSIELHGILSATNIVKCNRIQCS